MAGNDRDHFEDYRQQTRVKHDILESYLPAYFHILKKGSNNLVFIDGFAGKGTYAQASTGDAFDGSPLRALKLIANNKDFSSKVATIFIESDDLLFASLENSVNSFYQEHKNIREPLCVHGAFKDCVAEVIEAVEGKLAPTFLFVDPCGVSGANFQSINSVMQCKKCELFIFFNIDGVRRIAGLSELSDILIDLMGSQNRASELLTALNTTRYTHEREELILQTYCAGLREDMGLEFIIPFRVEYEDKRKTSHYLIHACRHPLGFRIMKDVMWRRGQAADKPGALGLAQASRVPYKLLFDLGRDAVKDDIRKALASGPLRVSVFCEDWVNRPDDLRCEPQYKAVLLEMEASGVIRVLSKDGKRVVNSDDRPKRNNKPTLANDFYVELPTKSK